MDGSSSNADDGADRIDGVGALHGARVGSCRAGQWSRNAGLTSAQAGTLTL